jgi:phthiocerol/phenolphthiocerol synthesis type-I polyketide synthase C
MDNATTLLGLIEEQVARGPERLACRFLRDDGSAAEWTYGELRSRWGTVGAALAERCRPGERALLLLPQGLNFAAAFFGCLASGVIAVPAYPPRPRRPSPRLERIIADCGVSLIVTDRATQALAASALAERPELASLPTLLIDDVADTAADFGGRAGAVGAPAFLQYTSGSTGDPKGVMISDRNLVANIRMIASIHARVDEIMVVSWQPLQHDMGLVGNFLAPLVEGGAVTLMSPAAFLRRPAAWLEAIDKYRGTHCGGPGFAYDLCVDRVTPAEAAALDLSSWKQAFCGAEPIRAKTLDRFAAHFAPAGFRRDAFYPCYGLAEATLLVSGGPGPGEPVVYSVDRASLAAGRLVAAEAGASAKSFVGCGGRLLEQDICIVDPATHRLLGDDELGEIWTRGPGTASGYWNRPEQTAAVFDAATSTGERGYLHTGDLGFLRGGELFVAGRLKELIVLRGVNLYPEDLEQTACSAHAAVVPYGAAVVQIEIDDEQRLLVAAEIAREHRQASHDEVIAAIRQAITAEHEVRTDVVVLLPPMSLPRTSSGKVQRTKCGELYVAGELPVSAKWEANGEASTTAADGTPLPRAEHMDATIDWLRSEIGRRLGVPAKEVDVRAPFDRFGIDSADSVEIAAALGNRLGRHLPATLVYEFPTIETLARYLAGDRAATASADDRRVPDEPLAIVGMACRFPGGADSPEAFWELLRRGVDAVGDVPAERWDVDFWYDADPDKPGKMHTRRGAFLSGDVNEFDAPFFGIAPREAGSIDPQQRLLLETAWHAIEDAGLTRDRLEGSDTGVFIGISTSDHANLQTLTSEPRLIDAYTGSGGVHSLAAGRISYFLGLQGPCFAVDTACSSSLVALHSAGLSLRNRECRAALVGGVNLLLSPDTNVFFSKLRALSPDGKCKSFDASADGYVRGEGCGVVVVKRLTDALADGDQIHAVVRGSAVNHGGRSNGLFAPNAPAQERVIRQALAAAGVAAEDVDYVEAHGTGTALGDPIELRALGAALGDAHSSARPLRIGTAKTNVGHLEAASGMAGLVKAILSLEHEELAPLLHFRQLNPYVSLADGRMSLVVEPTPWPRSARRRIAGVSSFGFGGTNAHVILEEAPRRSAITPAESEDAGGERMLVVSGPTDEVLRAVAARFADHLATEATSLDDICRAAAVSRTSFARRAAVIASSRGELVRLLDKLGDNAGRDSASLRNCKSPVCNTRGKLIRGEATSGARPRFVWLFSGQGSQYAGMGRDLYDTFPAVRRTLDECQRSLRDELPIPLLDVMFRNDAKASPIDETTYTQPALFALGYALAELWESWGCEPACMLGHSIGEYVAACRAGVFSLEDALLLTARRGRLMQQAPGEGLMAAVFAPEEELLAEIAEIGDLSIAAANSRRNTVVSGARDAVQTLVARLAERGVTSQTLATSHAFHSSLMEPILPAFRAEAERVTYSPPQRPIISNLNGELVGAEIATPEYWVRHLREPVRFAAGLRTATAAGCDALMELGPTPVLLALARDVLGDALPALIPSLRSGSDAGSTLRHGLAELYVRGASIDWKAVYDSENGRRTTRGSVSLPAYPFQRQVFTPQRTIVDYERRLKAATATVVDDGHPFLGGRIDAPPSVQQHRRRLTPSAPAILADHRVFEKVVFPAAGFVETALAAGAEWFKRSVAVAALKIERPLVISADEGASIQTVVYREVTDVARLEVFRRSEAIDAGDTWILHASGRLEARDGSANADATSSVTTLESMRSAATESVDIEDFYRMFRDAGLDYGPAFQTVREIRRGSGCAVGRLEVAAAAKQDSAVYHLDPTLLDGAFQLLAACLPDENAEDVYLPTGCERVEVWEPLDGSAWAGVHLRPADDAQSNVIVADIRLWTAAGRPAACVNGLALSRVPRTADTSPRFGDWLYEMTWEPCELRSASAKVKKLLVIAESSERDATSLCERMAAAGWSVRCESAPGVDESGEPDYAAWSALIDSSGTNGSTVDEVAYFAPRQVAAEEIETDLEMTEHLESSERRICGDILALTRMLAARVQSPRLRLITAGAQAAGDGAVVNCAHATVWGLARSLSLEHPNLRCVRIDLPGRCDSRVAATDNEFAIAEALAGVFLSDSKEDQVAVREGATLVARLRRYAAEESVAFKPSVSAEETYRLKIGRYGILESLRLENVPRRKPNAGEVEIEVRAAALNFRDVLHVLGMLNEHAEKLGIRSEAEMPLGFECAGVVTAVGADVEGFRIGDEVLAGPAVGCLARHVVVRAAFVARKPQALSFTEAAALPIAYLTASYAFEDCAKLQSGERVLIHSAAGGVGQAAVQVARSLGAEVFATAGKGKWEVLRRQGVDRIMNSRDLEFENSIAAATAGRGVDVVLNSLNGEYIPAGLRSLAPAGRFVEIGKLGIWSDVQVDELRRDVDYQAFDLAELAASSPELVAGILRRIVGRIESGVLKGLPVETFALSDAAAAFRRLSQAKHVGKVVIEMANDSAALETPSLHSNRTYLITGGLGALGLRTAQWLADRGAGSLALIGRSEPREETLGTIEKLRRRGVGVRVFSADVSSRTEVDGLLAELADTMPPLAGIVHAAGSLDDGLLAQQSWARFRNVFAPKVLGAWNLHFATKSLPIDFFVCYSSVAATIGSPGQANYAAANAFLDALMQHRRALGLCGLSIAWGPWAGRGMAGGAARNVALERTMAKLPATQAFAAFDALLTRGAANVTVARIKWDGFLSAFPNDAVPPFCEQLREERSETSATSRRSPQARDLLARFPSLPVDRRLDELVQFIRREVEHVFGCEGGSRLDPQLPLQQQGLDSLMGVELKNRLEVELGAAIPVTMFFEGVTIRGLAEALVEPVLRSATSRVDSGEADADATVAGANSDAGTGSNAGRPDDVVSFGANGSTDGVDAAALLAKLDELTEAEIDRLLQAELEAEQAGR